MYEDVENQSEHTDWLSISEQIDSDEENMAVLSARKLAEEIEKKIGNSPEKHINKSKQLKRQKSFRFKALGAANNRHFEFEKEVNIITDMKR